MKPEQETPKKERRPGRHPVLGAVVLMAMSIAALAFGAGLYMQAGIGLVSSVIAGVALLFVMIASHMVFVGSLAQSEASKRLALLEATFSRLDRDVERISKASDATGQLEELAQRVHGLRRVIDQAEKLGTVVNAVGQIQRLTGETERLDARLEALRSQTSIEAKDRHEAFAAELKTFETLVKQLADHVSGSVEDGTDVKTLAARLQAFDARFRALQDLVSRMEQRLSAEAEDRQRMYDFLASATLDVNAMSAAKAAQGAAQREADDAVAPARRTGQYAAAPAPDYLDDLDTAEVDMLMAEEVRRAVEANRIELYLQPVMIVPQRRVRYYEALTRLKSEAGRVILPADFLPVAEHDGLMPVIDNVMLYRSVQVLRRLEKRSSARGVFCNISLHSLLDTEFFAEFMSFMEQHSTLSDSMFFEFSQRAIENCGPVEMESLAAVAALGFRFSLDKVHNLDVDFQQLHDTGFRHIKIESEMFLHGMAAAGARIHPVDMKSYLDRFGMQLIVEKVEDETALASVLDHQVRLAQGNLFSEPRPVRPEVFGEKADAEAA